MTSGQRIIKYCAIAFAIFLIVSIFRGIFQIGYGIINGIDFKTTSKVRNYDNVSSYLDIDLKYTDLKIVSGDQFKVETENKNIEVKQDENKLTVKENKTSIFKRDKEHSVVVYIPETILLDSTYIGTGAGKIEVEYLNTRDLRMDLGAGKTTLKNTIVLNSSKIDTGAGEIQLFGKYNNLDVDLGVGNADIFAELTGLVKIDCGVGNLNLRLPGDPDSYTIEIDKGIGKATLDGEEIADKTIGNGETKIKIDGGVGTIKIEKTGNTFGA